MNRFDTTKRLHSHLRSYNLSGFGGGLGGVITLKSGLGGIVGDGDLSRVRPVLEGRGGGGEVLLLPTELAGVAAPSLGIATPSLSPKVELVLVRFVF